MKNQKLSHVSFRGVIGKSRELVKRAASTVALSKSNDMTLDEMRGAVREAILADVRFPTVKAKTGDYMNSPWLRDVLMPDKDGGEWTAIVQQAASTGSGDLVKIGFTIGKDSTITLAKGDPQPTKLIYKSATFTNVIGSAAREHAEEMIAVAGDVLSKAGDKADTRTVPVRSSLLTSFTISKGNTGHTGRPGGGSFAKTRTVGGMKAKLPRFRAGQRVVVGDEVGRVVGNELRAGEHHVKVRTGTRVRSVPQDEVSLSKTI